MLILTRRIGESVIVGNDITITVFEVHNDSVRIGIDAPRSVSVHRSEVYEQLQAANQQAASSSDAALDALRGTRRDDDFGDADPGDADPGDAEPTAPAAGT